MTFPHVRIWVMLPSPLWTRELRTLGSIISHNVLSLLCVYMVTAGNHSVVSGSKDRKSDSVVRAG